MSTRRRTFLRRLIALRLMTAAWALVVAAGALEIHGAEPGRGHEPAVHGDDQVFLCDSGHLARLHVEAAHPVEREHCPGCLHRLQLSGGELLAAPTFSPPLADVAFSLLPAPHVAFAPGQAGGSRAPPLS